MRAHELEALRLLARATADINSSLELDEVLPRVARRIKSLVNCHLFAILLWNQETGLLEARFAMRFDEQADFGERTAVALGQGISGSAAKLRRPQRVGDVRTDGRYLRFPHQDVEIRSELAIPLLFEDRLIGVLDLESMDEDAFSEEHEQLLVALAAHIASALENARLHERLRADEQRLERDLATARTIQRALLPRVAPRVKGLELGFACVPARQLGGDFYDFVRYRDGRLGVAAGDVAGKATPAALYGALAIGILRGQVSERKAAPGELLAHLNEQLCALQLEDRFLSMVYVVYEPPRRTATIANAGFPTPHHVRAGVVRPLTLLDLALGIEPGRTYADEELPLQPGDLLVFWTDGLLECRGRDGEAFGAPRLCERLAALAARPAQEVADGLLEAAAEWSSRREGQRDDRTVVVLRAT